ncbi:DUF4382 domain-containing protein [Haloparvum sp. PAK95]|uniref:DUF4382 domain-containing protein n=1 Tax=Haloparvum sp. PAK95 TaxID=3418962 RepID=UPI003D2F4034
MNSKPIQTLLVVGMLLIAGCAGGVPGTGTDGGSADTTATDAGTGTTATDAGTVNFYISDEENAIDDFQHLNVTITKVGFEKASSDGGGWEEYDVDNRTADLTELKGANATLMQSFNLSNGNYTKVFVHVGEVNATLQNGEQVNVKLPSEKLQITKGFTVENGSETNFVFDIAVHKAGNSGKYILKPVISQSGTDVPIRDVDEDDEEDELTIEFDEEPVRGENATLTVTRNGSAVANATVEMNDETVGTTDASGQLTVTIPDAEEVEFEVEHEGAEGELELEFGEDEADEGDDETADEEGDDADDAEEDEQGTDEEDATDLNASFVGNVTQGENATVRVTRNDSAVENATVEVNGEGVGTTDANGELTFEVPETEKLEVEIEADGAEAKLEVEFDEES